ncbi:MAG: bifunctional UDP-N-acetylmuramoyl-tripeptide:D-alanyl-D-alanine ligase/alanine racemase [Bacteroidales bacterium]|nr:bifunctional UDP-N-acetylmuramoyl-tripeptide:D-alanyl-D-alanine ligase/alanine racemase [Bacteroidales bacterium]
MTAYTIENISRTLVPLSVSIADEKVEITTLLTDSRSLTTPETTLFFAIPTKRNSGCRYVDELYSKGVRSFVLPADAGNAFLERIASLEGANVLVVSDVVAALQAVAKHHRQQFAIPVVGITGSNGKTVVKDWIVQLLSEGHKIVSSPKSYNSQIGVPLSVWQMTSENDLAVFEAGISQPGEMTRLQDVMRPTIGVLTNIGQAHNENFPSLQAKIAEKLRLFADCDVLVCCEDHADIIKTLETNEEFRSLKRFTWGRSEKASVLLLGTETDGRNTQLSISYNGATFIARIPFSDNGSVQNAMHCIALMLYMGCPVAEIQRRTERLLPVAMRLEVKDAINGCQLVDDAYSLDINSLVIALDFVRQERQHAKKTLILSDIMQSGRPEADLYTEVAALVRQKGITKFIGIGEALQRNADKFPADSHFFKDTDDFIANYLFSNFQDETILLKGARVFHFEKIARLLQRKSHETIMEVNLDALIRNLNYFRSRINPTTKLMAMVKAFSYGAGSVEIANALQTNHVDYLTVAYTDEGVDLRQNGITLPIMVMNPEEESFESIIKNRLEPDIYSLRILDLFSETSHCYNHEPYPIHIEFDTGMHRLGFMEKDIEPLAQRLNELRNVVEVKSIFSHLACSEDPDMDDFTRRQIINFRQWSGRLKQLLGNDKICCHILNSSGITRFPEADMDMVRLGIGLYGISPEPEVQKHLTAVSRLKTRISQIKDIPEGDSVGYNCRWVAQRPSRIAIIPIGYADGLNRRLGNGNGKVVINNHVAPIIGTICMDMCFIDVTDVQCAETDEVIVFGDAKLLQEIAADSGTITYEILTSISHRVKRVYYRE